jgi:hypothetical protein
VIVKPRPCCGKGKVGKIFRVDGFSRANQCGDCGASYPWQPSAIASHHLHGGVTISRLKRIPPLDELERDQIVEELTV